MSENSARTPSSSQTVGPYFRIGLEYLMNHTSVSSIVPPGMIEIRGRVLDRDGVPVTGRDAGVPELQTRVLEDRSMGRKLRAAFLTDSDASRLMKRVSLLWRFHGPLRRRPQMHISWCWCLLGAYYVI